MDFTAIDFETAEGARNSICQVGICRIENNVITKSFSLLVQPPENKYNKHTIEKHGITPDMTSNAPMFNEIWDDIKPYIENQLLVMHNSSFDSDCLTTTLEYFDNPTPEFTTRCTYKLTGHTLNIVCQAFSIKLEKHHDAKYDAEACANLYIKLMQHEEPDYSHVNWNSKKKKQKTYKNKKLSSEILIQDLSKGDPNGVFYGKKVVFSGDLPHYTRDEAGLEIQVRGGKVSSSLSMTNKLFSNWR